MKLLEIDETCCLKAIKQGGKTGDNNFRNQHGVLIAWVVTFGVDEEFFTFSWRERFVPFLSSSKNSDRVHEHFDLVEVIT